MSLKEFDAKQFLLEKGERVGLVVAVTLMVLMLILSLFMPGAGFFSGSPNEKRLALKQGTERLDDDLRTKQPTPADLPEQREGRLIDLDTRYLQPDSYAPAGPFFEPRMKENPNRRPPIIYPVEEAVVAVAHVPIDTYLFSPDFKKIWVLTNKEGQRTSAAGGAGNVNPFAMMGRGGMGGSGMPMMGGAGGAGMRGGGSGGMASMMQSMRQGAPPALRNIQAATDSTEYDTRLISVDNWNPQELTAHQVRPLRMAIIAGSFPYRKQLEEHKSKLRLKSFDEVLNEEVKTKDDKKTDKAFRFLGVEVQRREVDANGKELTDWVPLTDRMAENYRVWLKYTFYPFEPEDPKLEQVRFPGLAMPLLREFHASQATSAPGGVPGMNMMMQMMQGKMQPGAPQQTAAKVEEAPPKGETHYPDLVKNLPKIQATLDTLAKLNDQQLQKLAKPKFRHATLDDPFNPEMSLQNDNQPNPPAPDTKAAASTGEETIPEYVLARAVDLEIQPGKHYRYRLRIKMANPNYKKEDVASPEYKEHESLESKQWYEIPQTVSVPPETLYYVVDEKQGKSMRDIRREIPMESAQYRLWNVDPRPDQVVMQFHRWVDTTARSRKDSEQVPVGEWAIADRVLVARGEYVGRKVNVDIPIWIYNRNAFILPTEEKSRKRMGKVDTGIDVDFGPENPDDNLILVDFEGGKINSPPSSSAKFVETSAIEVLMYSPNGKLLARNNAKDINDKEREERRTKALQRIQDVRVGKKE